MDRKYTWISVLITLLMLIPPTAGWSTTGEKPFEFTPTLQRAYFEIQKLRISNAHLLLQQSEEDDPGNPFAVYVHNYADLFYLMVSEDAADFKRLSEKQDVRLAALDRLPATSPYRDFLKADLRLHWAFIKLKFGNEMSACWDVIKAYRLLEVNQKQFPGFIPHLKSLGLLHVLIGSVPDKYNWVTKILGLKGDIQLGIGELRTVQKKSELFRFEARLIDLLLHAYTLGLTSAQSVELDNLVEHSPDNLLIHFFGASINLKSGHNEKVESILDSAPAGKAYLPFPFLNYLRGEMHLRKLEYREAAKAYQQFLDMTKGLNFIQDSYFKQFMCAWLQNNEKLAEKSLSNVNVSRKPIVEADQYAVRFALQYRKNSVNEIQKVLFKARYLCDGGYYSQAWAVLQARPESDYTSTAGKAEFNYRQGRILQEQNKYAEAIPALKRAVELSEPEGLYFGAAAALQLGYIYKQENNRIQANASFQKALSFRKHEYKNSVDNKAKAALSELNASRK